MSGIREIALDPHDPGSWEDGLLLSRQALERNELLVHPTSTVYGLGAKVSTELDMEINRLKGREPTDPLIRLAGDVDVIRSELRAGAWNEVAERLASRFWPGPLTLVLDDGSASGTAVRVDGHPVLLRLLERWPSLMTSTSMNVHGGPPTSDPADVRALIVALPASDGPITFLSAGILSPSAPSTVVSLRPAEPTVLREGPIDSAAIAACLAELE